MKSYFLFSIAIICPPQTQRRMQCETHKPNKELPRLENQSSTLGLLVTTIEKIILAPIAQKKKQIYTLEARSISRGGNAEGRERPEGEEKNVPKLEVLAALQGELLLGLASSALETQDDLLGGLGLLVEDRLGLTTVTTLLSIVTTLTLGEQGGLEGREKNISALVLTDHGGSFWLTLPALYWVTLCWVCLWHSLDLQ